MIFVHHYCCILICQALESVIGLKKILVSVFQIVDMKYIILYHSLKLAWNEHGVIIDQEQFLV